MTRPLHSRQLDGLSILLSQLSEVLAENGAGRTSLGVMRAHADAIGFPTGTLGGGGGSSGRGSSSTERAAVLENDPTIGDYDDQVRDLLKLASLARTVIERHRRYTNARQVTVCGNCSEELPRGRVRCPKCNMHPDTRICQNVTCMDVLGVNDPGRNGWCVNCAMTMSRKGRLPTAEEVAKRGKRERERSEKVAS